MKDTPNPEPTPPDAVKEAVSWYHWIRHHLEQNWKSLAKPPVIVTLVLIGFLSYRYGLSQSSEEISVKSERIAFLNEQITAYKDRLQGASPDQAAKQLSTLQSKLDSTEAKLQMMLPDNYRHLSQREVELLTIKANDLSQIGIVPLYAANIGDSVGYLWDFARFFAENKIRFLGPFPTTCEGKERGVLVGLKDGKTASEKAKVFMEVLKFAGLTPSNTKWVAMNVPGFPPADIPDLADFTLFICPP